MPKPRVIGFVFARGGSKGVPRKNIRPLAGKPLIAYAIECGLASRQVEKVVLSTDDSEIAAVARQFGAEVPFLRPSELAQDDSPEWMAWQHAIRSCESLDEARPMDVFLSIPATSPLRSPQDLDRCVELLLEGESDLVLTVTPAKRSPYFNMVKCDSQGYVRLAVDPGSSINRRQDAPAVYEITTVAYAAHPRFILNSTSMWDGRVKAIIIPNERSLDIDTEIDFQFAEFLINNQKKS